MYSFNCLIKTDASLVKGSLSESYGETELLANLYGKIICIEDDANGMSPTETVPTPVDVFDIILGYREASELISMSFLCPVLRYNTLGKANEFTGMYRRHPRRTQALCQ